MCVCVLLCLDMLCCCRELFVAEQQAKFAPVVPPSTAHPTSLHHRWRSGSWTCRHYSRGAVQRRHAAAAAAARAVVGALKRQQRRRCAATMPCPSPHFSARQLLAAGNDLAGRELLHVLHQCTQLQRPARDCATREVQNWRKALPQAAATLGALGHRACRAAGGAAAAAAKHTGSPTFACLAVVYC